VTIPLVNYFNPTALPIHPFGYTDVELIKAIYSPSSEYIRLETYLYRHPACPPCAVACTIAALIFAMTWAGVMCHRRLINH
jgi:hypothetical protein